MADERLLLWLRNRSTSALLAGGASSRISRLVRLRSTAGRRLGGTGFASRLVTARKKRRRGFFKRFKLGKLFRQVAAFTPAGRLLI